MKIILNKKLVQEKRRAMKLSWQEIAEQHGLPTRQHAYEKLNGSPNNSAKFFGKIFDVDPDSLLLVTTD